MEKKKVTAPVTIWQQMFILKCCLKIFFSVCFFWCWRVVVFFKRGVLFPLLFLINSLLFVSFSSLNASQQGFENTPLPYKPPEEESWICETACADVCVKRKQHPPPCTGGEMPSKHNCYGSPRCINSVITVCLIVKAVISIKEGWACVCVCLQEWKELFSLFFPSS